MNKRMILIEIEDLDGDWYENPLQLFIKTSKPRGEILDILKELERQWFGGDINFETLRDTIEYDIGDGENEGDIEVYQIKI